MIKWITLAIVIIVPGMILGQSTYYHDCDKDQNDHIHFTTQPTPIPGHANPGDSIDIVISPIAECHREVEFLIDFQSYNVPDQIVILEDGVITLETEWFGDPQFGIPGEIIYRGYAEYLDGALLTHTQPKDNIPPDFHTAFLVNTTHVMGMFRIRFYSDADEIIIRVRSYPLGGQGSAMSTYVHCTEAFDESVEYHLAEYICYEPVAPYEVIDNYDCTDIFIVDSINVSQTQLWDTICVNQGTWVTLDINKNNIHWKNGINPTFQANNTIDYHGLVVNGFGCEFLYHYHIIVVNPNIFFPNVFTPNYDGNNDIFTGYPGDGVSLLNIKVFDRWGNMVYQGLEWDGGTYMSGVYTYVAEVQYKVDSERMFIAGDVTLLK